MLILDSTTEQCGSVSMNVSLCLHFRVYPYIQIQFPESIESGLSLLNFFFFLRNAYHMEDGHKK